MLKRIKIKLPFDPPCETKRFLPNYRIHLYSKQFSNSLWRASVLRLNLALAVGRIHEDTTDQGLKAAPYHFQMTVTSPGCHLCFWL